MIESEANIEQNALNAKMTMEVGSTHTRDERVVPGRWWSRWSAGFRLSGVGSTKEASLELARNAASRFPQ
jgi:hypothetical protein